MRATFIGIFAIVLLSGWSAPSFIFAQAGIEIQGIEIQGIEIQVVEQDVEVAGVTVHRVQTVPTFTYLNSWGGGVSTDMSRMVFDPQIRKNLELDDEQVLQMRDIQKEFGKKISERLNELNRATNKDSGHYKEVSRVMGEIRKGRQAALGAVLLPHQSKRLEQIKTQLEMKNRGDANLLVSSAMAEELGIDRDQQKRIKQRAAKIKKEMAEKIARIQQDGRKELLRELSPSQREQLRKMMGEKFEYKTTDPRDRINRMRERSEKSQKEKDR